MLQFRLETHLKLYFSNIFIVIIKNCILRSNNTGNLTLRKGFQNPHLAFYLKQMNKPNLESELKLELCWLIFFPGPELEFFSSYIFCRAGAGAFRLHFFCSELELEPQSSGGQIGAGSKLEPIVHLWGRSS